MVSRASAGGLGAPPPPPPGSTADHPVNVDEYPDESDDSGYDSELAVDVSETTEEWFKTVTRFLRKMPKK